MTIAPVLSSDPSKVREPGTSLKWETAKDDSGNPLSTKSQYLLYSDDSQDVASFFKQTVDGTSVTLTSLVDGETYLIKLVQELTSGQLVYSNTLTVEAFSKPQPPIINSITGTDNGMTVDLTHQYDGHSNLTSITFLLADKTDIFTVVRPLSYTQSGSPHPSSFSLTTPDNARIVNYVSFEICCFVTNEKGDSELSNAVLGTPSNTPNQVQSLVLSPQNTAMGLSWTDPSDFSEYTNSSVLKYEVFYTKSDMSTDWSIKTVDLRTNPERSVTISSLENGVQMLFKVRYVNDFGIGIFSETKQGTPFTVPTAVRNVSVTPSNTQIDFSWDEPLYDGGLSIVRYVVKGSGFLNEMIGPGERSSFISGLENGTLYQYTISASIYDSQSDLYYEGAETSFQSTPYTFPSSPQSLSASVGDGSVSLSWSPPADNGGKAISGYAVKQDGVQLSETVESDVLTYTISNLINGQSYDFEVVAFSSDPLLYGSWSNQISATPFTFPSKPLNFSVTPQDSKLSINWSQPEDDGGFPITQYQVKIIDRIQQNNAYNEYVTVTDSAQQEYSLTKEGLVNGAPYSVSVRAMTTVAEGIFTNETSSIPFGKPILTDVTVDGKSLIISYDSNGRPVDKYHALALDSDPELFDDFYQEGELSQGLSLPGGGDLTEQIQFPMDGNISKYLVFLTSLEGGASNVLTNFGETV